MVGRVILHSSTRGCSSPNNSEWLVGLYSTQVQGAARLQTTASGWSGYTPLKYKGLLVSKQQRVVGRVILHSSTRGCSSPNNSEWLVGLYSTQVQGAVRLQTVSGWSGYTPLKYKGLYSTQVQGAARLQTTASGWSGYTPLKYKGLLVSKQQRVVGRVILHSSTRGCSSPNSEWLVGLYSTQVQGAVRLQTVSGWSGYTPLQGAVRLQTVSGWSGYTPLKYKGLLVSKQTLCEMCRLRFSSNKLFSM